MAIGQSTLFSNLDVRVGKIVHVEPHPSSAQLYIEKVQVGPEECLEIVCEHATHFKQEELVNRMVAVLCNLRCTKIAKHRSRGQILAVVKEKNGLELIEPPEGSEIGDRVIAQGEDVVEPMTSIHLKKLRIWENASKELQTNSKLEILYKGFYPLSTKTGKCKVESLAKASLAA